MFQLPEEKIFVLYFKRWNGLEVFIIYLVFKETSPIVLKFEIMILTPIGSTPLTPIGSTPGQKFRSKLYVYQVIRLAIYHM